MTWRCTECETIMRDDQDCGCAEVLLEEEITALERQLNDARLAAEALAQCVRQWVPTTKRAEDVDLALFAVKGWQS